MPPAYPSSEPDPASIAVLVEPPALPPVPVEEFQQEIAAAADFTLAALAPATRRAYRSDFLRFGIWCRRRGLVDLPAEPETVAVFLASEAAAGLKPATIARRAAAIRYAHGLDRKEQPTSTLHVRATVAGVLLR